MRSFLRLLKLRKLAVHKLYLSRGGRTRCQGVLEHGLNLHRNIPLTSKPSRLLCQPHFSSPLPHFRFTSLTIIQPHLLPLDLICHHYSSHCSFLVVLNQFRNLVSPQGLLDQARFPCFYICTYILWIYPFYITINVIFSINMSLSRLNQVSTSLDDD